MSGKNSISDPRVLAILNGGESFKRRIDPDGLLKDGVVREIRRCVSDDGRVDWRAAVSFSTGDVLYISGFCNSFLLSIHNCKLSCGMGSPINIPVLDGFSLLKAFGDLSRLPHQLKRNLSVIRPEIGHSDDMVQKWDETLFNLERDSLFWSVEVSPKYMVEFRENKVVYTYEQSFFPSCASLYSFMQYRHGRITVETSVDVYGLGGKTVGMNFDMGENSDVRCDCHRKNERGRIPSVDVAVELYDRLFLSDKVPERHKKLSRGKPTFTGTK